MREGESSIWRWKEKKKKDGNIQTAQDDDGLM